MDKIDIQKIIEKLDRKLNIKVYDTVTSTNTMLKDNAQHHNDGDVIIAQHQTNGRGRIGKSFFSPDGTGIYISFFLTPKFNAENLKLITPLAAVAMCDAIKSTSGKNAEIKWVNDIFTDNKKVCGILTESSIDYKSGKANYVIVGVGINVYKPKNDFPSDLKNIAGNLLDDEEADFKNRLIASFFNSFFKYYENIENKSFYLPYKEKCFILGKRITVLSASGTKNAEAIDISNNFELLVKYDDGSTALLNSGEISIKIN